MIKQAPKYVSDHKFYKVLNKRVKDAMQQEASKAHYHHYFKLVIVILWALSSYALLYFVENYWGLAFLCLISGVGHTVMGFNVFHDSIHGSLPGSKILNKIFAFFTCSLLGVSHFLWRYKHNYLHHQFTNIEHWDDDLETREALRLSPSQKMKWQYRFQHLYAPFAYGLTSIEWIFIKDYVQYFTRKMNSYQSIPKMKKSDHFEFWVSKLIYFGIYVILPFVFFDFSVFIVGFLIFHFSHSLAMASIFQLAHVMPQTLYPNLGQDNRCIEKDFGEVQLETTVNFGMNSKFLTWFSGGLNYQIEHHLFPRISHVHYPFISKIVKQTARDFGLNYKEIPSYSLALKDHFITLKKLGRA